MTQTREELIEELLTTLPDAFKERSDEEEFTTDDMKRELNEMIDDMQEASTDQLVVIKKIIDFEVARRKAILG
jgi:hypothetical protein